MVPMNDDAPCAEQLDAELRADLEVQQKQNKELAAERDAVLARNAECPNCGAKP